MTEKEIHTKLAEKRMSSQRITGERFNRPEEVVRWMGAVQAQDYGQAVWAVGARTHFAVLTDVEQALVDRRIVRTWPMRGTIHFVLPEDAKWMVKLSAARMLAADRRRQEQLGLNEPILERCNQLFYDALKGGGQLSRPEMMRLLQNAGISTDHQRAYHILWYAAQTGLICIGPMQAKQQTFLLLDELVPNGETFSREEALAKLALRYYTGHGPATIYDFAWWAGLPVGEARSATQSVRQELASETIEGNEYWMAASPSERMISPANESFHLLPGFDEYLLGYRDREAVLRKEYAPKIVPGGNGVFKPMIVYSGQVVGSWKRILKKNTIEMVLAPFTGLAASTGEIQAVAQRYSRFFGMALSALRIDNYL